ncbi:MAG: hypothetical protein D6820_04660, partial [Lentisphaerae bacterium]
AKTQRGILFDDFQVRSVSLLPIPNIRELRLLALNSPLGFLDPIPKKKGFLARWFGKKESPLNPDEQDWIQVPPASGPRDLLIGSPQDPPHKLSCRFIAGSSRFEVGLDFGYTDPQVPWYRFLVSSVDGKFQCRLQEIRNGKSVRELAERSPNIPWSRTVHLTLEPGEHDVRRFYVNNQLVFVQFFSADKFRGASGLYVGPADTAMRISMPEYRFFPEVKYMNRFEKNRIFVTDPFMRHWSSPEGEWFYEQGSDEAWYKSDYYGYCELNMPFIEGGSIFPGVPEGKKSGGVELQLRSKNRLLLLVDGQEVASAAIPLALLNNTEIRKGDKPAFTFCFEKNALWLICQGQLLFQHYLSTPMTGSRIRLKGFPQEKLRGSYVRRSGVRDFLFTEALHDWKIHGGVWEVINRFMCKPYWSHLNGQSEDGVASLWAKYRFTGDFCAEMYVGLRHGKWYNLPGRDFNLTMLCDQPVPSRGYTVTCSGWDPDEMQQYTTLYRNGKPVARSNIYTAPRIRNGNKRKLREAIIAGGRDVHGAWYYIKLRRVGNRLIYYFDNEKILDWQDSDPLKSGTFGFWTYRNSMMVARVKVAADRIEPAPVPFRLLPVEGASSPCQFAPPEQIASQKDKKKKAISPVSAFFPMTKENIVSYLRETHGIVDWQRDDRGAPVLRFRNVLGGGSMATLFSNADYPLSKIAGVRFQVKRLPQTQFNFHFAAGIMRGGKFYPQQQYFHRLSGTSLQSNEYKMWGQTQIPSSDDLDPLSGEWHDVTVFFPVRHVGEHVSTPVY